MSMDQSELHAARAHFIAGLSDITQFWGFPRHMGALFGTVYLSPQPLTLRQIAQELGQDPTQLQPQLHTLLRLGVLHQQPAESEAAPTYTAETDFWQVGRALLQEREKKEFAAALAHVAQSMEMVETAVPNPDTHPEADFYRTRMQNLQSFLDLLDQVLAVMLTLDEMRLQALLRVFGKSSPLRPRPAKNQGKRSP
jgi:DNA-binding transcriptional regulator GbsR (MarR family)